MSLRIRSISAYTSTLVSRQILIGYMSEGVLEILRWSQSKRRLLTHNLTRKTP